MSVDGNERGCDKRRKTSEKNQKTISEKEVSLVQLTYRMGNCHTIFMYRNAELF